MPDPKKKQTKGTPAKKKAGQTGYGPQNRPGTFAKKKKGIKKAKKKYSKVLEKYNKEYAQAKRKERKKGQNLKA